LKIIIDGNDGTGKTSLVKALNELGLNAVDRGILTKMTDGYDPSLEDVKNCLFVLLDVPIVESQRRLLEAGKDINEKYHNLADLSFYRSRFLQSFTALKRLTKHTCLIDNTESIQSAIEKITGLITWQK
jgi:thymidylate kinase